jgi:hypothetical protein
MQAKSLKTVLMSSDEISRVLGRSDIPELVRLNHEQLKLRSGTTSQQTRYQAAPERNLLPVQVISWGWSASVSDSGPKRVELTDLKSLETTRAGRYYGERLIFGEGHNDAGWLGEGFENSKQYLKHELKKKLQCSFAGSTTLLPLSAVNEWISGLAEKKLWRPHLGKPGENYANIVKLLRVSHVPPNSILPEFIDRVIQQEHKNKHVSYTVSLPPTKRSAEIRYNVISYKVLGF